MSPAHNYRIIRLKEVDSTNAWAKSAYAEKIVSSNAAIVAATQHAGRGQMRTKWHDESGKNILLTLVVDVQNLRAVDFFRLNEAVSLALIDVLTPMALVFIKWPNDIIVAKKKLAGILIETVMQANHIKTAFIGIGLNVNQQSFPEELNATSLAIITGKEWPLNDVLSKLLIALAFRLQQINTPNILARQYNNCLFGTQEYMRYKDEHTTFYAKVHKIEADGRLVLKLQNESVLQYYHFKEVQLLLD